MQKSTVADYATALLRLVLLLNYLLPPQGVLLPPHRLRTHLHTQVLVTTQPVIHCHLLLIFSIVDCPLLSAVIHEFFLSRAAHIPFLPAATHVLVLPMFFVKRGGLFVLRCFDIYSPDQILLDISFELVQVGQMDLEHLQLEIVSPKISHLLLVVHGSKPRVELKLLLSHL